VPVTGSLEFKRLEFDGQGFETCPLDNKTQNIIYHSFINETDFNQLKWKKSK
jgi:hypothetical protein